MVHALDAASCVSRDAAEGLGHHVDGHVVVLGDTMRRDDGIHDEDVELASDQRLDERLLDGHGHLGAALRLLSDDDLGVAPTIDEESVPEVARLDAIAQADRGDTALDLFVRVLAVPVPHLQRSGGRDAK